MRKFLKLYLGGHLSLYSSQQQAEVELTLTEPVKLVDVLVSLGIPRNEVQIVLVNDQFSNLEDATIEPLDYVKVFSQIDGG